MSARRADEPAPCKATSAAARRSLPPRRSLLAARNGMQSALMAPTELLAWQHAGKLAPLLLPFGITLEAVFGSQSTRSRTLGPREARSGEAAVAVGTHALLSRVSISIGWAWRSSTSSIASAWSNVRDCAAKGFRPHTIHMTATPIPRTLAQSVYADLDLSIIDELPPGRTPIETFAVRASRLERVYEFVRKNVAAGHQAYIVAPAIEEGEGTLTSVVVEAERLEAGRFSRFTTWVVAWPALRGAKKKEIMGRFVRGEIDVLVSTTVVEVGVDVPNATAMVVLGCATVRAGATPPTARPSRTRRSKVVLHSRLSRRCRRKPAARDSYRDRRTDSRSPMRTCGCAVPASSPARCNPGAADVRLGDLLRDVDVYRAAKLAAENIVADDPH